MSVNQRGVAGNYSTVTQGEKTVGATTVQLVSSETPCMGVWIGAPTTNHTKTAANTGNILVGFNSGGNESGGRTLANDDYTGMLILASDASKIYLTGFNANDVVEYQIYKW